MTKSTKSPSFYDLILYSVFDSFSEIQKTRLRLKQFRIFIENFIDRISKFAKGKEAKEKLLRNMLILSILSISPNSISFAHLITNPLITNLLYPVHIFSPHFPFSCSTIYHLRVISYEFLLTFITLSIYSAHFCTFSRPLASDSTIVMLLVNPLSREHTCNLSFLYLSQFHTWLVLSEKNSK
jgi:hypothetical protein